MDILKAVGARVQAMRKARGLTQEDLEERSGVNAKYIGALERGQKNATVRTIERIATGLGVEPFELLVLPADLKPEKTARKAVDAALRGADLRTLNLCLEFLRKT
jgi:transcriptional regulator with XRE-family HTH domain